MWQRGSILGLLGPSLGRPAAALLAALAVSLAGCHRPPAPGTRLRPLRRPRAPPTCS